MDRKSEKHAQEAKAAGLVLIGPGSSAARRLYLWPECGHTDERDTGAVRKKKTICKKCIEVRHAKEALAVGLHLIGPGKGCGYKKYRWVSCRHVSQYRTSAVRIGSVMCQKCA